ncbi:ABC transporter ATP-binding protein [Candidatus Poribacteria bacterium]|jgi:putative ABC transport system ATP-binding protein|nr:ABC transporter ATP-binding protein [Candidatus Poribacteria bacterium]MBT5534803.1 ABC transporter ATP-binding protein [Candidatus Poribacteria bacterium]MBT5714428.1 ABC transporter ATP-binding protein [Candidatus Poribacteria bacterium]MBT7101817.1 ABC transporter ATP-binding protein [Candidatus Poribacteria bacterium]MBT7807561.1 ABC transporter ATP-binding protein [Candidatus Poribacteria bacterium]
MTEQADDVVRAEQLTKVYRAGEVEVLAVTSLDLTISRGEFMAIAGPSGSGKTTLLNLISGLDKPTSGRAYLAGVPIEDMNGRQLADFRRDHVGFIFQSYNLIPVLTVSENVEYVMILQRVPAPERRRRVAEILSDVGLAGMEGRRPPQLSGGQQQRVAVARAMVAEPDIVLADEPTANLDSTTGAELIDMMRDLNRTRGMTFIFSTHDEMIMTRAERLVLLKDGRLDKDIRRDSGDV